jgi:hypothetical protein
MQNNVVRKCFIIGIIILFFGISTYQNCTLSYPSDISFNNGLNYPDSATNYKQLIVDLGFRDVIWNVTLSFDEPDGANDYTIFGEAPDANDGVPPDDYDEPKPPAPPTPYIRSWFNDSLNEPYNFLWKDYRHYPDTSKKWNLSVQWVPTDFVTPTTVTISWSTVEVGYSEYNIVKFCNNSEVQLRNMLIESNYSFLCPAMVPQIFYIICQGNNTPPEKPEKPSGQTQVNTNIEYTYSSRTIDIEGNEIYYLFDWGDGNNSGWIGPYNSNTTASAKYTWTTEGIYQIKVKAKDTSNAESEWSDSLIVTVDNTPPTVNILKPVKGLYIIDKKIRPFFIRRPLIIGRITINVNATDYETGVDRVEFYGGILGTKYLGNATIEPYNFTWKRDRLRFIHMQILKVIAYDKVGNKAVDRIIVHKFL